MFIKVQPEIHLEERPPLQRPGRHPCLPGEAKSPRLELQPALQCVLWHFTFPGEFCFSVFEVPTGNPKFRGTPDPQQKPLQAGSACLPRTKWVQKASQYPLEGPGRQVELPSEFRVGGHRAQPYISTFVSPANPQQKCLEARVPGLTRPKWGRQPTGTRLEGRRCHGRRADEFHNRRGRPRESRALFSRSPRPFLKCGAGPHPPWHRRRSR